MYGTLISTQTLATTAASVTFSSIPGTYTDLVLVFSARAETAVTAGAYAQVLLNGSNSSNAKTLEGSGVAASSQSALVMYYAGSDAPANTFGNSILTIPNYTSSVAKAGSAESVGENNASSARMNLWAPVWGGVTVPVTSLGVYTHDGSNFAIGSVFSLYGLTHF